MTAIVASTMKVTFSFMAVGPKVILLRKFGTTRGGGNPLGIWERSVPRGKEKAIVKEGGYGRVGGGE